MSWQLVPRVAIGPLRLGMAASDALAVLGRPQIEERTSHGETEWHYFACRLAFDSGGLVEVSCQPPLEILFEGHNILRDRRPLKTLAEYDEAPVLCVGLLLFLRLGIGVSGFVEGTEPDPAVVLFAAGRFDEFSNRFIPFDRDNL